MFERDRSQVFVVHVQNVKRCVESSWKPWAHYRNCPFEDSNLVLLNLYETLENSPSIIRDVQNCLMFVNYLK